MVVQYRCERIKGNMNKTIRVVVTDGDDVYDFEDMTEEEMRVANEHNVMRDNTDEGLVWAEVAA